MVVHSFNPSTQVAVAGGSLVYRASSKTATAIAEKPPPQKNKQQCVVINFLLNKYNRYAKYLLYYSFLLLVFRDSLSLCSFGA